MGKGIRLLAIWIAVALAAVCAAPGVALAEGGGTLVAQADTVAHLRTSAGEESDFGTVADAFAAADDGSTISLINDAHDQEYFTVSEGSVTLDLNGCDLSINEGERIMCSGGSLSIVNNGESSSTFSGKAQYGLLRVSGSSLTIGTDITVDGGGKPYALVVESGTGTLDGGSIDNATYAAVARGSSASLVVKAGSVSGTTYGVRSEWGDGGYGSVSVSGGSVSGGTAAIGAESAAAVSVSGGSFSSDVSAFLAEGLVCVPASGGDQSWIVGSYVASVTSGDTTTYYESLGAAVSAAGQGSTVRLLADVAGQWQTVNGAEGVTLDLAGHDLAMADDQRIGCVSGSLAITNSDAETPSTLSGYCDDGSFLVYASGGAISLGGNLAVVVGGYGAALYAENGGTVTVAGGSVTASEGTAARAGSGGRIEVTGGALSAAPIFHVDGSGAIVVSGGVFSSDVNDYLAEGYACVANDDEATKGNYPWTVAKLVASVITDDGVTTYYTSLADAVAAAGNGSTVTLLADVGGRGLALVRR